MVCLKGWHVWIWNWGQKRMTLFLSFEQPRTSNQGIATQREGGDGSCIRAHIYVSSSKRVKIERKEKKDLSYDGLYRWLHQEKAGGDQYDCCWSSTGELNLMLKTLTVEAKDRSIDDADGTFHLGPSSDYKRPSCYIRYWIKGESLARIYQWIRVSPIASMYFPSIRLVVI